MLQAEPYKNQLKCWSIREEKQIICDKRSFVVENRALFISFVTALAGREQIICIFVSSAPPLRLLKHTSVNTHSGKQANSRVREHPNRYHIHSKCENMPKKGCSYESLRIGKQNNTFTILMQWSHNLIPFCRGNPCEYKNLHWDCEPAAFLYTWRWFIESLHKIYCRCHSFRCNLPERHLALEKLNMRQPGFLFNISNSGSNYNYARKVIETRFEDDFFRRKEKCLTSHYRTSALT